MENQVKTSSLLGNVLAVLLLAVLGAGVTGAITGLACFFGGDEVQAQVPDAGVAPDSPATIRFLCPVAESRVVCRRCD